MQLKPHQKEIIDLAPKKFLLALGTGSGKTATTLHLAQGKTLVICPKQQRDDRTWEKNKEKFEIDLDLTVITKEEFRRDHKKLPKYDTLIADESHFATGVSTDTRIVKGVKVPKTSQIFDAIHWYIKTHNPERFYLASATPADKPMKVFALGVLFGKWGMNRFFEFRDKYYWCKKVGYREMYLPRKNEELQQKLIDIIKSLGVTGELEDWFDVPPQNHETIYVDLTEDQKRAIEQETRTEADPNVLRGRIRGIENGVKYGITTEKINDKEAKIVRSITYYSNNKIQEIKRIVKEKGKTIIFACYTGQIKAIEKALKEEGIEKVLVLNGQTKPAERKIIIETAETTTHCVLIVQSSISAGWEVKSCRTMIFASLSYLCVDFHQAMGRILRLDNLSSAYNTYYHLVVKKGIDEMCYNSIMSGNDFIEKVLAN